MTGNMDGRTARRERNRNEVVQAALALVDEGVEDPTIDQLTERSGVSARSVFRYFEGLDDLRRAVIRRHFERVLPILESVDAGDGSLDTRIKRFVDSRLRFNESIAGPARTAQLRAHFAPVIADDIHEYRRVLDASVRRHFAPELKLRPKAEAEDLIALIDVLVSFDGWDLMTRDHQRSRTQIRRAWALGLESLLSR
jgi:TetR/AcrR family transcriptional regulator, regulator of autoinduction and epiphytic fitness